MNDIKWKIKKQDGQIYGPADIQTMRKWIEENRVTPDDLISLFEKEDWKPAKDYPQFAGVFSYGITTIEQKKPEDKSKSKSCINHPDRVAFGLCLNCGRHFCQDCIKTTFSGKSTLYTCSECGGKCESLEPSESTEGAASQSFGKSMLLSLVYPFRGSGAILLAAGTLSLGIARFLMRVPIYGFFVSIIVYAYIAAYMFKIIKSSAYGESEPPDFPNLRDMVDDIFVPYLQIIGTVIISFIIPPIGIIYFPMALIAVAIFGSIRGVDPRLIFPSILRAPIQYLVTVVLFYLVFFISRLSQRAINLCTPPTAIVVARFQSIPLHFLIMGVFIFQFLSLYFIMVDMNILGSFYFTQRKKLVWFRT